MICPTCGHDYLTAWAREEHMENMGRGWSVRVERFGELVVSIGGLDLNPAYHELAKQRTAQRGLRFEEATV